MNIRNYKKIILLGSGGSGKSYFAKHLAGITGYPLIHLDHEFWQLNWVKTPGDEWVKKQEGFVKGERWIIDGNYSNTMELRFVAADLVIFLDINRYICMYSVWRRRGKKRSDLPDYLKEKIDVEFIDFLKWIWSFPKTSKAQILSLHEKYPDKKLLVLKSRKSVKRLISELKMQV